MSSWLAQLGRVLQFNESKALFRVVDGTTPFDWCGPKIIIAFPDREKRSPPSPVIKPFESFE